MAPQFATKLALEKADDRRAALAAPDLRRFAMLAAPLGLLLVIFQVYRIEQPSFRTLAWLAFGGFAVSYWLPLRWKEPFLILLSLSGAYALLGARVATLVIVAGLLVFSLARSALPFAWKVSLLVCLTLAAAWARTQDALWLPNEFWPAFTALFMFRTIIYFYQLKQSSERVSFREFLSYFFLLPNYYFTLFPVVDLQTFRDSRFTRDIHIVAQQGVWWIFRGTTHLLIYRIIYLSQASLTPEKLPVAAVVTLKVVSSYLLYLRVSGQFHIAVGMLLLFGYDLPETHHRYFLAHSISDFWHRVNIYWKDFMVKIFYFPAYFSLRRRGKLRAQLLATLCVFVATWFLHAYQFFWLQGNFQISANDTIFWGVLCLFMCIEALRGAKPRRAVGRPSALVRAAQIAVTFVCISILWSMWSAHSITEWLNFLRTGRI